MNQDSKLRMNPGYVIEDPSTNQDYGVFVNDLNDNYLVFRLDNNTLPVFSKIRKRPNLQSKSHINHTSNKKLKDLFSKIITFNFE